MPAKGAVSILLDEQGIRKGRLADTLGVSTVALSKYICGARRLNADQRHAIEAEHVLVARSLIAAFDAARKDWESAKPIRAKRGEAVPMNERVVDIVEPDDGVWYTIDEWKARFGEPGSGADVHGRMNGYFSTEPDYCEE